MTVFEDTRVVNGGENSTVKEKENSFELVTVVELIMKNQRGVTLVEILVIIAIMGAIFIPISMMLIYSLETEKEVSTKNDVQREARLIMEYVTEKMKRFRYVIGIMMELLGFKKY